MEERESKRGGAKRGSSGAGAHVRSREAGRIELDPPPARDPEVLRLDTWGYRDSGFAIDPRGDVVFRGERYPISGQTLPDLLPWACAKLDVEIDPDDPKLSTYPPAIGVRIYNPGFEGEMDALLGPDRVSRDPAIRTRRGHGHTQEEIYKVRYGRMGRVPDLVVFPESEDEAKAIVRAAVVHDVSLLPYGGGTNVTDALRCRDDEPRSIIAVDTSRMNRVRWIDPVNRQACIEAGATGTEIASQLAAHGFTLGHEPDSYELSTLGGWIATNASGMKKNRYGNIEDLVLGLTVVTPDGVLERASAPARESIGGDPARWLLGSEGRLGLVTSAIVKIFPLPERQSHGSVIFEDFEAGFAFLCDVQASGRIPASIRLMDNLQFQFGQALKPAKSGLGSFVSALEKLYVLGLRGFDANRMVACTLVFEGSAAEVAAQEDTIYALAARHGGLKAGAENGERGYQLTFAIAYIRDFMLEHHIVAESFETTVAWSDALALCENVKQRMWAEHEKRGLPGQPFITCRITQLYDTGVCIYFYYAFYAKDVPGASELYAELEQIAREEILRSGGSLSHHHGVGQLRARFLPEVLGPTALEWRRKLKQAIDPQNVFGCGNP